MNYFCLAFLSHLVFATQSIDQDAIRATIRDHIANVRKCYDVELKNNPSLNDIVVVDFEINDKGKVTKASVNKENSKIILAKQAECLVMSLKTWTFPKAPKGQTAAISYPFVISGT